MSQHGYMVLIILFLLIICTGYSSIGEVIPHNLTVGPNGETIDGYYIVVNVTPTPEPSPVPEEEPGKLMLEGSRQISLPSGSEWKIQSVSGSVSVLPVDRPDEKPQATKGMALYPGDTVVTGDDGCTVIRVADLYSFTLRSGSAVIIGDSGVCRPGSETVSDISNLFSSASSQSTSRSALEWESTGLETAFLGGCSFAGSWDTKYGIMEIEQYGNNIRGTYPWDTGKIEGYIENGIITGAWSEAPSYMPPNDAGDFEFTLSDDCNSFTGRWRHDTDEVWYDGWTGKRIR